MFLSIKATNNNQSLKMQIILSLDRDDSSNFRKKMEKKRFFWDQKGDFTIKKQIFCKILWFIVIKIQFEL